jgi:type IV pilus assembly protein PilA
MKKMLKRLNKREGFTLAELLIVVAIIAVLVAISIPVFTSQLEKARESTDAANLRAAYAEAMAAGLTDDTTDFSKTVTATQADLDKWGSDTSIDIGGIQVSPASSWTVAYSGSTKVVTINGASGGGQAQGGDPQNP